MKDGIHIQTPKHHVGLTSGGKAKGVRCEEQANQRLSEVRLSGRGQQNYTSELCIV